MHSEAHRQMRTTPMDETRTLYEDDFYGWTERQAALLRSGRLDLIDMDNLAEEIETLGRSEASALRSSYRLIAMHLLKLMVQPGKATPSWTTTIVRERLNVEQEYDDSPGLKPRRAELFAKAYAAARREAAAETGLPLGRFPVDPPFTVDDAEAEDFWPPANL